jgi:hypothetical protein
MVGFDAGRLQFLDKHADLAARNTFTAFIIVSLLHATLSVKTRESGALDEYRTPRAPGGMGRRVMDCDDDAWALR